MHEGQNSKIKFLWCSGSGCVCHRKSLFGLLLAGWHVLHVGTAAIPAELAHLFDWLQIRHRNPAIVQSPVDFHNNEHMMLLCVAHRQHRETSLLLLNRNSFRNLWHQKCFACAEHPFRCTSNNELRIVKTKKKKHRASVRTNASLHVFQFLPVCECAWVCFVSRLLFYCNREWTLNRHKMKRRWFLRTSPANERNLHIHSRTPTGIFDTWWIFAPTASIL